MPTDPETGGRFRINAKQTTKNIWTLDGTAEYKDDSFAYRPDKKDEGNVQIKPLGHRLLSLIKETEAIFRLDGRVMAGDGNV